uniref:Uncharacterized protein n=1 Tax=Guillardia theta TaxID=55529 RepID=A0A7S4P3G0_GUITH|mmetsp:Transcript_42510/g.133891  ORF Transcript_42510/g.133891 Transcript_42510/m.133891 type:complete len:284 (+) Transcript_42510:40-891(+)
MGNYCSNCTQGFGNEGGESTIEESASPALKQGDKRAPGELTDLKAAVPKLVAAQRGIMRNSPRDGKALGQKGWADRPAPSLQGGVVEEDVDTEEYHRLLDNMTVDDTTRHFGPLTDDDSEDLQRTEDDFTEIVDDFTESGMRTNRSNKNVSWREDYHDSNSPRTAIKMSDKILKNRSQGDENFGGNLITESISADVFNSQPGTTAGNSLPTAHQDAFGNKLMNSNGFYVSDAASARSGSEYRPVSFQTRTSSPDPDDVRRRLAKQSRKYLQKADKDLLAKRKK